MKKEKVLFFIILILLVSVIGLSIKSINISNQYQWKSNSADMALKSSLSLAMSGFALDFDKVSDENQKQYYYNEAMSNLYSASQLFGLSSYANKNNVSLDLALYNLYKLMEQNEFKSSIIKNSKSIYGSLLRLSQNPLNKGATENIIKLTEEIRSEK